MRDKKQAKASALFIEIPRQAIIVLFFTLLLLFFLHAWQDGRFLSSNEVLVLFGVRVGAGVVFGWLGVDD